MNRKRRIAFTLAALCVALAHGPLRAASAAQPTAPQILEAYIEAAGGFAALDAVRSLRRTGALTFESAFTGLVEGRIELALRPRERIRTASDLGAFSTVSAWDGSVGWEQGPQGFRILEGAELDRLRAQSDLLFAAELARSPDARIERQSDRAIDGADHYVVTVDEDGRTVLTLCFDQRTGLITQSTMPIRLPGVGDTMVVMDFWDYRPYQGVMLPDTVALAVEGIFATEMRFDETEVNGTLEDGLFAPPEAIAR